MDNKSLPTPTPSAAAKPGPDVGSLIVNWEYPEFIKFERGWRWYAIAVALTIALLVYAFFSDNQLFMIIIVFAAVIFTIANIRQPERIQFYITDRGVVVKNKFLPYPEINNFWIIYHPPMVKSLYIEPRSLFIPRFHIHLEDQNPVDIRQTLLQFLEENLEKEEEPQSDYLGRLLKF